ncbi:MAG: MurR/RpiR family transcriptional regulator [Phycisphaerae bacterium]|nr:MurR/RpiR family transcriptional regulator [Phycisphaerae bacterium]
MAKQTKKPTRRAKRAPKDAPAASLEGYSFPLRMQMLRNRLTDAEKRVGAYFLDHPKAAYLSITEVVETSSLGYGSIIRFCRKLGCAGFQEFKVLLARELAADEAASRDAAAGSVSAYLEKIRSELADTGKLIDEKVLHQAAQAVSRAPHVLVAGIAGSEPLAVGFNYRLSRLGVHSLALSEGYNLAIRAAALQAGDVLFAISFSGATKDILTAAEVAKRNKATVISLTNFLRAPLVELADLNLFSATDRDPMHCEIFSNISLNFVLDVLFAEIFRIRKNAEESVVKTFNAVSDRRI